MIGNLTSPPGRSRDPDQPVSESPPVQIADFLYVVRGFTSHVAAPCAMLQTGQVQLHTRPPAGLTPRVEAVRALEVLLPPFACCPDVSPVVSLWSPPMLMSCVISASAYSLQMLLSREVPALQRAACVIHVLALLCPKRPRM